MTDTSPLAKPYNYLEDRAEPQRKWYDDNAKRSKRIFTRMQVIAVVVAALVPVTTTLARQISYFYLVATVLGLTVGLIAAFEGVLHYRDQWKNYRSTELYVGREITLYRAKAGPYRGLAEHEAVLQLVERIEDAIAAEGVATLSVMTVPPQSVDGGDGLKGRRQGTPQVAADATDELSALTS